MNLIRIRRRAVEAIATHALDEAPLECCGLLIGDADLVDEAVRARNLRQSTTAYLVDPADQFAAIKQARRTSREVIGAYHSHPTSDPVPSVTDLAEATYPDYVYVIVRPAGTGEEGDIRAYRLVSGSFVRMELVTVP